LCPGEGFFGIGIGGLGVQAVVRVEDFVELDMDLDGADAVDVPPQEGIDDSVGRADKADDEGHDQADDE
jgi:hypothetical protein